MDMDFWPKSVDELLEIELCLGDKLNLGDLLFRKSVTLRSSASFEASDSISNRRRFWGAGQAEENNK